MTISPNPAASHLFNERRAGVLLHPTSLPPDSAIEARAPAQHGNFGAAERFLDFLAEAGFSVWQMLPIGPTHADRSPYQLLSAHAGNSDLIDIGALVKQGWLSDADSARPRPAALALAAAAFFECASDDLELGRRYADFCRDQAHWLDDYALFVALREQYSGAPWHAWPRALRRREPQALADARAALRVRSAVACFEQFVFSEQWRALRAAARRRGIHLFGDMPIFVSHDSADVWASQNLFKLDDEGLPLSVAGVPPDYFSATGQRWGNPLYDWTRMQAQGFAWWLARLRTQLNYFDLIRIDHFRGFEAFWEIPTTAETAIEGHWVAAPGAALLTAFFHFEPELPLVAENLGVITEEVEALRRRFRLPGMLILQFAFDGSARNPYLPHQHDLLEVVYTGTHDNDTTLGWYQSLDDSTRARVDAYLGHSQLAMPWPLVCAAFASVARMAIVPMQDLLGLDGGARMNVPGTGANNWRWRFDWSQLAPDLAPRLRHWLAMYGRLAEDLSG